MSVSRYGFPKTFWAMVLAFAVSIPLSVVSDRADAASSRKKTHFIEFRARESQALGHTLAYYGKLNSRGKVVSGKVAALHPATNNSAIYMLGHIIPVRSETGGIKGDTDDRYLMSSFRVLLTAAENRKVVAYIKKLNDSSPVWHGLTYNCNAFVGDIAKFMGFETPSSLESPQSYIDSLRRMNLSKKRHIVGTPVKMAAAAKLRARARKTYAKTKKK